MLVAFAAQVHAADTYGAGQLSIPLLAIGSATYSDVLITPAFGVRTPVQLGLYCTIPVGAVTPLTLQVQFLAAQGPVAFSGTGSTVDTGALGSLTLTAPSAASMLVTGGSSFASYSTSGSAAAFELFPPTPTSGTLTDPVSGMQIEVTVASNTQRNLTLSITQPSSGAALAAGAIDQSGTGSMTYSDGSVEQVTSWTLGGAPPAG